MKAINGRPLEQGDEVVFKLPRSGVVKTALILQIDEAPTGAGGETPPPTVLLLTGNRILPVTFCPAPPMLRADDAFEGRTAGIPAVETGTPLAAQEEKPLPSNPAGKPAADGGPLTDGGVPA
jgi:hypothetical protein